MSRYSLTSDEEAAHKMHRPVRPTRRGFLQATGGLAAAALLGSNVAAIVPATDAFAQSTPDPSGLESALKATDVRRNEAMLMRLQAAHRQHSAPAADHALNEDEHRYPSCIGQFSKGLPHNDLGEVQVEADHDVNRIIATTLNP